MKPCSAHSLMYLDLFLRTVLAKLIRLHTRMLLAACVEASYVDPSAPRVQFGGTCTLGIWPPSSSETYLESSVPPNVDDDFIDETIPDGGQRALQDDHNAQHLNLHYFEPAVCEEGNSLRKV